MKVKEFTIDRAKWYRGKGPKESCLLNDEGQMCCLGFFAKACGIEDDKIQGKACPPEVHYGGDCDDWESVLIRGERSSTFGVVDDMSFTAHSLMITNDYMHHSDQVKEEKIIKEFAYYGITVKFVG
jgi:hypothetical protein